MSSAVAQPVFSVPLNHFRGSGVASLGQHATVDSNVNRPTGLNRFVGDDSNALLKIFTDTSQQQTNFDAQQRSDQTAAIRQHGPLVFFGPSGTGKTSLALTLLTKLTSTDQRSKFATASERQPGYLNALDFDRRYRSALQTDSVAEFRSSLAKRPGLLIDNLHQLAKKPAAQHQVALLIDEMASKNRQIVLTMLESPLVGNTFTPQLASRLSGGLSLEVSPPGEAARYEIIRDLADLHGLRFTHAAIDLLVNRLAVTVPGIHHFIRQFKVWLADSGEASEAEPIDVDHVARWFQPNSASNSKIDKRIQQSVAKSFNVKVSDLTSPSRKQTVVLARGVAIYLNRVLLRTSFQKIGQQFGNRDHSTIMHAFRKIDGLVNDNLAKDPFGVRQKIETLKQQLAQEITGTFGQSLDHGG